MKRRTFGSLALPLASLLVSLLLGCGEPGFDRVEFSEVTLAPDQASFSPAGITVAVGVAAKVKAKAINGDNEEMKGDLSLVSADGSIVGVSPGPDDATFVIYGVREGVSSVRVLVSGDEVGRVPATVVAQKVR